MQTHQVILLSALAVLLFFTMGCTENNISGLPYGTSQFINRTTDLNYTKFINGDYNGMFLVIDNNKLSVLQFDINSYDINWSQLINFPSGCGTNQAVKIVGSSLVCVDLPSDLNYVPYIGAIQSVNLGDKNLSGANATFATGSTITVPTPTNGSSTQTASGNFVAYGVYFAFKVYAHKDGIYSQPLFIDFLDDGTENSYNIQLNWDAVAGADYYRIVIDDEGWNGYYWDAYTDIATNSLLYNGGVDVFIGDGIEYVPSPLSPYSTYVGTVTSANGKFYDDVNVDGALTVGETVVAGGMITGNRITSTFNNNAYDDLPTSAGIVINNTATDGQNLVSSYIDGAMVAKWRTDYVGNISWVSGATDYDRGHYFFTNGDYPDASWRATFFNSGVKIYYGTGLASESKTAIQVPDTTGNVLVGGANDDMNSRLNVKGNTDVFIGSVLGTEKLTNGTFTGNANGWTLATGWAYNTNLVRKQSDGLGTLSQALTSMVTPVVAGEVYSLTYTISNRTVGGVIPSVGGVTLTTRTGNGTYTQQFKAVSNTALAFTPSATNSRFYIDTISLKRVSDGNLFVGGQIDSNTLITNVINPNTNLSIGEGPQAYKTNIYAVDTPAVLNLETTSSDLYLRLKDSASESYVGTRNGQGFFQSDNSVGPFRIENYGGGLGAFTALSSTVGDIDNGFYVDNSFDGSGTVNKVITNAGYAVSSYEPYGDSSRAFIFGYYPTEFTGLGYDQAYSGFNSGISMTIKNETGNERVLVGGTNYYTNFDFNGVMSQNAISGENVLIDTKINGDLNQNSGNAFYNGIYGEDYNKVDGGFETVDLVTPDVYVRVKKLGAGSNNGFTVSDGNLIAQYGGVYSVNSKASVNVGVGGESGMKLFINDTGQNNCYSHQHLTNDPYDMVITCLIRLAVGDKVNIRFDYHASPVSDITISAMNVNLVRVGN